MMGIFNAQKAPNQNFPLSTRLRDPQIVVQFVPLILSVTTLNDIDGNKRKCDVVKSVQNHHLARCAVWCFIDSRFTRGQLLAQ
jgi:hypothetical protein